MANNKSDEKLTEKGKKKKMQEAKMWNEEKGSERLKKAKKKGFKKGFKKAIKRL